MLLQSCHTVPIKYNPNEDELCHCDGDLCNRKRRSAETTRSECKRLPDRPRSVAGCSCCCSSACCARLTRDGPKSWINNEISWLQWRLICCIVSPSSCEKLKDVGMIIMRRNMIFNFTTYQWRSATSYR